MQSISEILSRELGQKLQYIENVISLIDEGNTIPFIARYRKEMHGAMDDTVLRTLETRLTYLRNLQTRRDEVKNSIENQGKLTEELSAAIDDAATLAEVEDLYRPYKQKRRTRGSIAREKGLEPLAAAIFAQDGSDPAVLAQDYVDPEKGVETVEDAPAFASDPEAFINHLSSETDARIESIAIFISHSKNSNEREHYIAQCESIRDTAENESARKTAQRMLDALS